MSSMQHSDSDSANLERIFTDSMLEEEVVSKIGDVIALQRSPFALVVFDLDNSKAIRSEGIGIKIALIEELLRFIISEAPLDALVFGHGTRDDISLILPFADAVAGMDNILAEVDRLRASIASHAFGVGDRTFDLTVSGGVSFYPLCGATATELFLTAESACMKAKKNGRNRIESASGGYDEILRMPVQKELLAAFMDRVLDSGDDMSEALQQAIRLVLQRHSGLERFAAGIDED